MRTTPALLLALGAASGALALAAPPPAIPPSQSQIPGLDADSQAGELSNAAAQPISAANPLPAPSITFASTPAGEQVDPRADPAAGTPAPAAIPKMPAYTVKGAQVQVFRERDIDTTKGMVADSLKRHPGLNVGNAFNLNAGAAKEIFLEDEWRSTMADYADIAHAMTRGGDPAEAKAILNAVRDADLEKRAADSGGPDSPNFDRLQLGKLEADSRLLQVPENPVDIPFVRVKW
jgi:hypothetical protein